MFWDFEKYRMRIEETTVVNGFVLKRRHFLLGFSRSPTKIRGCEGWGGVVNGHDAMETLTILVETCNACVPRI